MDGRKRFFEALDDDFNTPEAWAALDGIVRAIHHAVDTARPGADQLREARRVLLDLLDVFALTSLDADELALPAEVQALADARVAAREARDFGESDHLRDAIVALGFEVRDTAEGQQVYRSGQ
jgi:cysteinyl-tRNA synthetase